MMPFWADESHSCHKCGAQDTGLYPENCRCGKPSTIYEHPADLSLFEWLIVFTLLYFSAEGVLFLFNLLKGGE
jgi:hypothetical protein